MGGGGGGGRFVKGFKFAKAKLTGVLIFGTECVTRVTPAGCVAVPGQNSPQVTHTALAAHSLLNINHCIAGMIDN